MQPTFEQKDMRIVAGIYISRATYIVVKEVNRHHHTEFVEIVSQIFAAALALKLIRQFTPAKTYYVVEAAASRVQGTLDPACTRRAWRNGPVDCSPRCWILGLSSSALSIGATPADRGLDAGELCTKYVLVSTRLLTP